MQKVFHWLKQSNEEKAATLMRVGRHPSFVIPLVTGLVVLLLATVFLVFMSGGTPELRSTDTHIVIINHDKTEQTVPTRARTVNEVLQRADIKINPGDVVEPELSSPIVTDNFRINVYRAVPVTIVDGDRKIFAYSAASTPRSIVKQAGLEVYPEDKLELLPADNFLTEASIGQRVVVQRSTPVNVNIYGTPVQIRSRAKTVDDLLVERGLKLDKNDVVQPAKDTRVSANMQIYLLRHGQKVVTEESTIAMPQEVVEDGNLTFGTTALRQQGAPGKKVITYLIETKDGKEVRRVLQEITTQEPVKQITARGKAVQIPSDKQAVMAAAGVSSGDYPYVDYIISRESGWCPTKWQGQAGICPAYYQDLHSPSAGYGYGLCQSTPAGKMASAGSDWQTNAVTQLRWCSGYAKGRYGTWAAAYQHWVTYHNW
jgi:uncharacterized protein YabE (DUF348 family)